MSRTSSALAPNCEWIVTPGFCCLNACSSAVNGVDKVPAPNTISVPVAPAGLLALLAGLLLVVLVLLPQAAVRARTQPSGGRESAAAQSAAHGCPPLLRYYRSVQSLTATRAEATQPRPHCNPRR